MLKFDNYVFFTICEYTLDMFKRTHYSRYRSFCYDFKANIELGDFSKVERERLFSICGHLMLVYGFDIEEAMMYIGRYFKEEKFITFELPIRSVKEYFSSAFN